ncbi:hypothetical protein C8Q76DRAFT_623825 [Earliella scabrosa]|nr:hypothetical protein C8Q76DRAFT_623825 [Earliella scabrosa]
MQLLNFVLSALLVSQGTSRCPSCAHCLSRKLTTCILPATVCALAIDRRDEAGVVEVDGTPGWKRGTPGWKRGTPGWKRGTPGWKRGTPGWKRDPSPEPATQSAVQSSAAPATTKISAQPTKGSTIDTKVPAQPTKVNTKLPRKETTPIPTPKTTKPVLDTTLHWSTKGTSAKTTGTPRTALPQTSASVATAHH